VRVVPDAPPAVKLRAEGVGSMVTPNSRIPLRIEASDDIG